MPDSKIDLQESERQLYDRQDIEHMREIRDRKSTKQLIEHELAKSNCFKLLAEC